MNSTNIDPTELNTQLEQNTQALYSLIGMVAVLFIERTFSCLMKIKNIKSKWFSVELEDSALNSSLDKSNKKNKNEKKADNI